MLKDNTVWCVFITYRDGDTDMLASFSSMSKAMDFKRKIADRTMAETFVFGSCVDFCDGDTFDITNIMERNHVDD
jgi:hypothetical protein